MINASLFSKSNIVTSICKLVKLNRLNVTFVKRLHLNAMSNLGFTSSMTVIKTIRKKSLTKDQYFNSHVG